MARRPTSACCTLLAIAALVVGCPPSETALQGNPDPLDEVTTTDTSTTGEDGSTDPTGEVGVLDASLEGSWTGPFTGIAEANGFVIGTERRELTMTFDENGLPINDLAALYMMAGDVLIGQCDPAAHATGATTLNQPGDGATIACTDSSATVSTVVFTVTSESDAAAEVLIVGFTFEESGLECTTNNGSGVIRLYYGAYEQGLVVRVEIDTTRDIYCPGVSNVRNIGFAQWSGVLAPCETADCSTTVARTPGSR